MAIGSVTPRDQLDRIIVYLRRAMRYWWLVGIIAMVGGTLTTALALKAKPQYVSQARLLHNERLDSKLLLGRDAATRSRNLGLKYQELLLAKPQLEKVITELNLLQDVVEKDGMDAAIGELKPLIKFQVRGSNMFNISFTSASPEVAQKVSAMLTEILTSEDRRLSQDKAVLTKEFLIKQKAERSAELAKRQREHYKFLAENPAFALDTTTGPGAAVRAAAGDGKNPGPVGTIETKETDPRLTPLFRHKRRIKASLDAPEKPKGRVTKTPEEMEAERAVRTAKDVLARAKNDLESKQARFHPAHPSVRAAQQKVAEAEQRLERAEATVPPPPPKQTKKDRDELQKELTEIERKIASVRAQIRREKNTKKDGDPDSQPEAPIVEEEPENEIVMLENQQARLTDAVAEARRRVNETDTALSKAEIKASQQLADEGAVLSVIEPPSLPGKPEGKGPIMLIIAGFLGFTVFGVVLSMALALVDDRLYTAGDLENLGIAPVVVAIPKAPKKKRFRRG